jgi:Protein of unknown function (DUF1348)
VKREYAERGEQHAGAGLAIEPGRRRASCFRNLPRGQRPALRATPVPDTLTVTEVLEVQLMLRRPLPPFAVETAMHKVRMAEGAWNTRDPERVVLAYTEDSRWRNRAEFFHSRQAIIQFLQRKWARELDYRSITG